MFSDLTLDLGGAVVILLVLFGVGELSEKDSPGDKDFELEEVRINDDEELLILGYLKSKSNVESKSIVDLILDSEDNEEYFEDLKEETQEILGFWKYSLIINYPSNVKTISNAQLDDFYEIKLPSRNGDIILIEMGVELEDVWS